MYPSYKSNNNNNSNNNKKDDDDHNNPINSRLHLKAEKGGGDDFLRLNPEAGGGEALSTSSWGHEVVVHASGRKKKEVGPGGPGGVGVGGEKDGDDDIEMLAPGGIRVKTEITLTREKRIDYLDRLY